jgi:alginate O-acetyltransferase complex protein AlgI
MLFSAPLFLFIFMPLTAMTYVAAPRPAKNGVLLIASLLFYFWGEPVVIFMIAALAVIDYCLVARIARGGPAVVWYLAAGIGANLAFLFVFKYADFAMRAAEPLSGPLPHLNLVLPLGISFVVFEKITYLVDVYRGAGRPARSLKDYLLFVFFFPKMLAGPIIKYRTSRRRNGLQFCMARRCRVHSTNLF